MATPRNHFLRALLLCTLLASTAFSQERAVHEANQEAPGNLGPRVGCAEGCPDCPDSLQEQPQQRAAPQAAETASFPGAEYASSLGEVGAEPAQPAAATSGSGGAPEGVPEQHPAAAQPAIVDGSQPETEATQAVPVEQVAPAVAAAAPAEQSVPTPEEPAATASEQMAPVVPEQLPVVPEPPLVPEEELLGEEPRNFALSKDGAKVIQANKEAKKLNALLDGDSDTYVKNDCKADKWFIIELSQLAKINKVELHQYELYSSRVKSFEVRGRQTHPRVDGVELSKGLNSSTWKVLGMLTGENKKGAQLFTLEHPIWVRYLLLLMQSHYGSEPMCAINGFAAYGKSAAEELEDHLAADDTLHYLQSTLDDSEPEPAAPQPTATPPPTAVLPTATAPVAGSTGAAGTEVSHGGDYSSGGAEQSGPVQQEQLACEGAAAVPAAAAPALEQQQQQPQQECSGEAGSCPGEPVGSCTGEQGEEACAAQLQQEQQLPASAKDAVAAAAAPAPSPLRAVVEDTGKSLGSKPSEGAAGSQAAAMAAEGQAVAQQVSETAQGSEPSAGVQQAEAGRGAVGADAAPSISETDDAAATAEQGAQAGVPAAVPQRPATAPSGHQPASQEPPAPAAQQQQQPGQQHANWEGADEVNPFLAAAPPRPKASASVYDILLQEIKAAKVQQKLASKSILELQRNVSHVTAELGSELASLTTQLSKVQQEATLVEEAVMARLDALVGARLQALSQEVATLQQAVAAGERRELTLACLLGMLGLAMVLGAAVGKGLGSRARWVKWAVVLLALGNTAAGVAVQLLGGGGWSPAAVLHALPK